MFIGIYEALQTMKLILCQLYKYTLKAAKMKVLCIVHSLHFAVKVKLLQQQWLLQQKAIYTDNISFCLAPPGGDTSTVADGAWYRNRFFGMGQVQKINRKQERYKVCLKKKGIQKTGTLCCHRLIIMQEQRVSSPHFVTGSSSNDRIF